MSNYHDKNSENSRQARNPLHVGRPNIGDTAKFTKLADGIFESAWLTNRGPLVEKLERRLEGLLGVRHCITTCNGTVALELAIRALELKGKVILPALTFVATAHALQWQEIEPVFCDIDPDTRCIDPDAVEELITPDTSGILGVHLYGQPPDIGRLQGIADRHGLNLLFDSAHAFGCSSNGLMIGNFGACEVFSFHATKVFNTFEGGAVATNDDDLARKIRLMENFGFAGEDNVIYIGVNGKMTEICAAMGHVNLDSLQSFIDANRANYRAYREGLAGVPGVQVVEYDESQRNNYHYIVLEVDERRFGMSRDALQGELKQRGILARRYFYPGCHRMEPYRTLYPDVGSRLPVTEDFCRKVLVLPTGTQVPVVRVNEICSEIAALRAGG